MNRLGLKLPLILAPMAGGVGTPALAAAVSQAGGLGSLGAAYLSPEQIRAAAAEVRAQTERPFAVNLFAPASVPTPSEAALAVAYAELAPLHAELNLPAPHLPEDAAPDFDAQLAAVLDVRPAALSFTFGVLPSEALKAARGRGLLVIGTATTPEEADALASAGVDALVVQGREAGGHWGGWQEEGPRQTPTLELLRQVVGRVPLPLIAAGGLMTAADVRSALAVGASFVQCGTAFLLADEAGTSAAYRAALLSGTSDTVLTRQFSGRVARGLPNRVTAQLHSPLPYPYQNALTRPLRTAAAATGRAEFLSLWAGEGYMGARGGSAAEIARVLCAEITQD